MMKFKFYFLILIFSTIFLSQQASASSLFFKANQDDICIGDVFFVDVKVDNLENGCINTAQIDISFPVDKLLLVDFNSGNSFLSVWMENPSTADIKKINNKGKISFSGGVPGGYCGVIPGDPGDSNVLGRIFFQVLDFDKNNDNDLQKEIKIDFLETTKILLNDGLGTKDNLTKEDFSFVIQKQTSDSNKKNALQDQIVFDNTKPEPFVVYLQQNKNLFNGDYYVEFNTNDKQTGIDHYEILELRKTEKIGVPAKRTFFDYIFKKNRFISKWKIAKSPYRLEDQFLNSVISVKAIDKAGNERYVDFLPPNSRQQNINTVSQFEFFMILSIMIIIILLFILLIFFFLKRMRVKKTEFNQEVKDKSTQEENNKENNNNF